ncbi:hypothetical protein [Endozoicomonas sp. SCSIO W0465]|uniref:hypothetical protein n=1 Tax=Endozoicomonas sp. SCSIO W0465 TaxID=2918516 RepID=UPI002075B2A1|nr:hypothetical protein [Endozoicomonas sp. SCSIO W0465]USE36386.1 hypothetical protein MJO57_30925 [Endozoicomonas sp. SCSIO W0465]
MAIDAEKLDQETDAELAALMGLKTEAPAAFAQQEDEQDKQTDQNPPADELPPPPAPEPDAADEESEPPAPKDSGEDWQDKYTKAEESRKNAHALMTQATQKAADLERSNSDLQQQMAMLQAKVDLLSQQSINQQGAPSSNSEPASSDQFQELRKDYQELDPVFNKLDESEQLNQKLEQRLAAIEQARKEQEAEQARQAFWEKVRSLHPDVEQISASEDFKGWFARQGADVQELSRVSPLGAAQVMTLYKESAGLNAPKPNPAQKIQQAKQMSEPPVRSRSKPTTQGRQPAMTLDQIAAMPQKEFNDNVTIQH